MVDVYAYVDMFNAYVNNAYPMTYSYLYSLAEQLGTSYEALAISLGVVIFLVFALPWTLIFRKRLKRRKEKALKEKVLLSGYPVREAISKVAPRAEGNFEERVWMKFPADRVKVEMEEDNLIVKIYEPKVKVETRAKAGAPVEIEMARDIGSAMSSIARKYSLASITLVNTDGLLVESTSDTPGEEAVRAVSRVSSMDIAENRVTRNEISDTETVFAIPYRKTHIIALVKTKESLALELWYGIEKDLQAAVSLL